MTTPRVSVLVPYRDCGPTLPEALAGLCADPDPARELIVINDGSRDDGPAFVTELARRDPRVIALHTPGLGIVGALAMGLAHARGDLLARMDADNVCDPARIARQRHHLDAHPGLDLVATRVRCFPDDAAGEGLREYVAWQNTLVTADDHAREMFVESPVCHPSVMLRRAALDAVGPWRDLPVPEDYDLWLRMDAAGMRLEKLPETLVGWRHRPGRLTFSDPRYAPTQILAAKAPFLAARVAATGLPLWVWGAGPTGKRLARALEPYGVRAAGFVDIDPRKVGGVARGVAIAGPDAPGVLVAGRCAVVAAVGSRGARGLIRAALGARGFVEGRDWWAGA